MARPGWEAAFLIGIFPPSEGDAPLRWVKVQVFSGPRTPGRHCLSAVEGMDSVPEVLFVEATDGNVRVERSHPAREDVEISLSPWTVRAPGLEWTGGLFRELTLKATRPDGSGIEAVMRPNPSGVLRWAPFGNLLSYWTAFCPLTWNGAEGMALVERAFGAQTRIPVARLARFPWRWDVLVSDDLQWFGAELRGMRAGALLPGMDRVRTGRTLRSLGLTYRAEPSTPLAGVIDRGGFVGLAWNGQADGTPLSGPGFREFSR